MFVKDEGRWFDEFGNPVNDVLSRLDEVNEVILTVVPFLDDALTLPFKRTDGEWDRQLADAIESCVSPAFVKPVH